MPILLTTPLTIPGTHGAADDVSAFVQMVDFRVKTAERMAIIVMAYGNVVAGPAWKSSKHAETKRIVLRDIDEVLATAVNPATGETEVGVQVPAVTDFTDMVASMVIKSSDAGLGFYDALGRELYLWLLSNNNPETGTPYYIGTVV